MSGEKIVFILSYLIIVGGIYKAITDRNPVFSVLYLIISFLGLAVLLIFLGADYLAVLFVLIYGGAISILIMFVVMMLDLKELEIRNDSKLKFLNYFSLFFSIFCAALLASFKEYKFNMQIMPKYNNLFELANIKTNVEVIGLVLYNEYIFQFVMVGFLLFISMIVIISLVIRKQRRARSQVLFEQLKSSNLKMVLVK